MKWVQSPGVINPKMKLRCCNVCRSILHYLSVCPHFFQTSVSFTFSKKKVHKWGMLCQDRSHVFSLQPNQVTRFHCFSQVAGFLKLEGKGITGWFTKGFLYSSSGDLVTKVTWGGSLLHAACLHFCITMKKHYKI